jgi:UDP-glucose 4-epimerase
MNVLVTGGFGFIGSHLTEAYLKRKDVNKVVVYDDLSSGYYANLSQIKDKRLKVALNSVLDKNALANTFTKFKINHVNHQAAVLEVAAGLADPITEAHVNIDGTLNVLDVALKHDIDSVFFASSGAVYGEPQHIPIAEDAPLCPQWSYGVSKLAAERYILQHHKLYGLNTTVFRYSIVYGEREWYGRALTMFIKRIFIEHKPPVVYGGGNQLRDYINVKDVANAQMLALNNPKANGQVFNLSSGIGTSVSQLADKLISMSNKRFSAINDDVEEGLASQFQPERVRLKGELKQFVLDQSKAKNVLKWNPRISFNDGLKREVEWIKSNPEFWSAKPRV